MAEQRFPFSFDRATAPLLALLGVLPSTTHVTLTEHEVVARFGPWRCRSPLSNVVDVCRTGPYSRLKAIGPRLSRSDGGLTFGTTAAGGVCLLFAEPVPGLEPTGVLRHPGLTVTVADPDAFATAVRAAAGLPVA